MVRKCRNYWSFEKCKEEALKYTTKSEFQKKSNGSYISSLNNKWLEQICIHMKSNQKPHGYWTFDKCKEEALKYNNLKDFKNNGNGAFNSSFKNKWLKDITKHMIIKQLPFDYWTFDKCKEEALKYNNLKDFKNNGKGSYSKSYKNKWLDQICNHMVRKGNRHNKCIYSYEFSDNYVYVGLTYDIDVRHQSRNNNHRDQVVKHIKETNLQPIRKQLTDYIDVNDAIKLEGFYVKKYKEDGWNILNVAKTGGLGGGNKKWTYEKCKEESLKYKTKKDFRNNNSSVYTICNRNNWLDELCNHMIISRNLNGYWTFDKCKEESLKYKTRMEFKKKSSSAYNVSLKNKWLDELCNHMIKNKNILNI